MYEKLTVPNERNLISAYKMKITKRLKKTLLDGSSIYPTIGSLNKEKLALSGTKWFEPQHMEVKTLNSLMKKYAKAACLGTEKRITN